MTSSDTVTTRGGRVPRRLRDGPTTANTLLARRIVYLMTVFGLAWVVGTALTTKPPLLVGGLLLSGVMVAAILRRPCVGLLAYMVIFFLRLGEVYPQLAPLRMERVIGVVTLGSFFLRQLFTQRRLFIDASRPTKFLMLTVLAALYDLWGRLVRDWKIVPTEVSTGRLVWDGRDADGVHVAAGVYFVQLRFGDRVVREKITRLR